MKKTISVLLVFAAVCGIFCLSGCKKEEKKKGQTYQLELNVNLDSGYDWTFETDKENAVKIETVFKPDQKDGLVGKRLFKVTALKKGTVTATFRLRAGESPDYKSYAEFKFEIKDDLSFGKIYSSGDYFESQTEGY